MTILKDKANTKKLGCDKSIVIITLKGKNMQKIKLKKGDALIIVDVQNDFMPGGALPVPEADQIIPILNKYIELFHNASLMIIASRDWHPPNHCSFKENGGIWPTHCVAGTKGAEFPLSLKLPDNVVIISKATSPEKDAYSALQETELSKLLKENNIDRCFVGGVATDYCVLHTVLDLLNEGYNVYLLEDAIRAVNVNPGDGERAIKRMQSSGAKIIKLENLA